VDLDGYHLHTHSFPTRRSSDLPHAPTTDRPAVPQSPPADNFSPPEADIDYGDYSYEQDDYQGQDIPPPDLGEYYAEPESRPTRRSEEHTSELQSRENLVCRHLL